MFSCIFISMISPFRLSAMKRGVDGAWAFVVLFAVTISSGLTLGLANSAGVYTMEFLEYFSASTGAVGAITSVNVACSLGGGMDHLFRPNDPFHCLRTGGQCKFSN